MTREHDEPAFPRPSSSQLNNVAAQEGMSLRDYFAAQVLPAVYTGHVQNGDVLQESIAAEAYEIAEAMLEARTRVGEPA